MAPAAQDDLLTALEQDHAKATISPADRAMLAYAFKLTTTPGAMASTDVDALRAHGFDDRAVHDICAITAYYAFANRIADGLGVALEA